MICTDCRRASFLLWDTFHSYMDLRVARHTGFTRIMVGLVECPSGLSEVSSPLLQGYKHGRFGIVLNWLFEEWLAYKITIEHIARGDEQMSNNYFITTLQSHVVQENCSLVWRRSCHNNTAFGLYEYNLCVSKILSDPISFAGYPKFDSLFWAFPMLTF